MLSLQQVLVLTVQLTTFASRNAAYNFPPFEWFHTNSGKNKIDEQKGQVEEDLPFGSKHDNHGQEIEDILFGNKHQNGQEMEDFGSNHNFHKEQEVEEFNFGHEPDHHKGQEVEEINFGHKPGHPKGQEAEEINFGQKPDHHKGQEVEEFNFGHEPDHHKGQEVEEINFGQKPDHHKGQEVEEFNFGHEPDHHKGQEVEEINFGQKPDHHKGQEVEEINFGHKPGHPKGQEVEEINFGQKPDHMKGQEMEEFNFGQKPEHPKGQEVEEIKFEHTPDHPKGQEVEEIIFGHEPKFEEDIHDLQSQGSEKSELSDISKETEGNKGHWFDIFLPGVEEGHCTDKPKVPSNSILKCESTRMCELFCQQGFQFSENTSKVQFLCDGNKWYSFVHIVPECNPICEPPCQNNGICIAPNQCSCPKNFEGAKCQFGHKPCLNHPPVSQNSYVNCNSSNCRVKCFDNYSFPDGATTADLICRQGQWIWTRTDWDFLPECKPSCQPPCINGGTCLDLNKCQCPRQYVGPQCQYELADCDAKKLNFNGYYTCRGENDKVKCSLSCPEGYETGTPLAKEYVCYYSDGKFSPEPVPKCIYEDNSEVLKFASSSHTIHGGFGNFTTNQIPHNSPSKGECSSWKSHYKNFDGQVFSFDGGCSYIMVEDMIENTFRIVTENLNCELKCTRSLKVNYENNVYKLYYEGKTPVFTANGELIPVPTQFPGISIEKSGDEILIFLQDIDVTINLNSEDHASVIINENLKNKTRGLCGNFNNNPDDDFSTPDASPAWNLDIFLQSWADDMYNCELSPNTRNNCTDGAVVDYCNRIFKDVHFEKCFNFGKLELYKEACKWDLCKCGKSCACETISEFVKNCKNLLVTEGIPDTTSDWREIADCSLNCPPGKVYSICGPSLQPECGSFGVNDAFPKYSECVEGCFCPQGLIQFNNSCISKEYCPCKWRNQYYDKGKTITKDCNTCTCQNGEWLCTTLKCSSRCSVVGNSHYRTFDGKRYDLSSQCGYYLLKSDNYSIESENQSCEENILNEIFHSYISKYSSCTKIITIRHKGDEIKLKKNKEVILNGAEHSLLPLEINGVIIRISSLFLIVKLPDNTEVWWDGSTNVYIDLPGNDIKPTKGLCGSFNNNQKDDFKTSEGDIEETATHFARKWKTEESCNDNVTDSSISHPCDLNVNYKSVAERYCQKLKESVFKDCHPFVDVEPFYKNCLYDVCSCQREIKYCVCPIFSDYASECISQNIELHWRSEIRECGLHCPQGQIYQPLGDSCGRSCQDISIMKGNCEKKYIEGCSCPDGLVLNSAGHCIPVFKCPCLHHNFKFKPNQEIIMEGDQFCTCQNALWSCRQATHLEIARDYENSDFKCEERPHEEYTTCKPAEPKTCKNMHEKLKDSTRICFPGCVCIPGFVWDSVGEVCVNASECPCHHGGRSYADGEEIQQDCNSCKCKNGIWSCTERECASVCSTWGDSHFKTFDGKLYDFQGSCDFVLASGVISEYETFFISLQIVPCGSTGISCPKSVTLKVGSPDKEEKVVFKKSDKFSTPGGLERILIREVGIFIFAEVFDLGLTLQWDKGTRVYVKIDSKWKNKVKGLCGNFNNNELDDFKTPSSGETSEISPVLFADSWRLQTYCPESNNIVDTCARRPHRKAWAVQKCSILHSETFEACHSEVSLEPYFERCVVDTCGCDEGGDCDCMCTAVAAYAEECTLRGVPIKWRTQEFCPLQCHSEFIYNPCISACPPKSCENQFQHSALLKTCSEESCVEGCDRHHCPPGEVLADSSSNICIPITSCKTVCLTVNNVTYLEGDLMESDDCHSCYCSHHKEVCTGKPCPEVTTTSPSLPTTSACSQDQIWDDCIVKCDHLCNHLNHKLSTELLCSHEDDCISGCRSIDLKCSLDMFMRDVHTCVHKKDCPCQSPTGLFIKPGDVVHESECEKCQCINNEYECSNVCTALPPASTTQSSYNYTQKRYSATTGWDFSQEGNVTLLHYTKISPPTLCPNNLYESLVDKFTRFSASSHLDQSSSPVFSQMSAEGIWTAGDSNADQYLQVDLGRVEAIYAVTVAGNSGNYVTAYHLLHSLNGDKFLDIINQDGKKEVFGGPFEGHHSVKQVLRTPLEARYIRFHPISWHGQISMKVDIMGCQENTTPTTPTVPYITPSICNKPIGIGQNHFPKFRIIVSSSKPNNGPEFIGFDNENGWQPLTNSKFEYIQLDFGDYGNFTGITTKGVSQGNELSSPMEESWVERFKIEYSHDGLAWNPVLDEFGDEMTFMGNTDGESEKKNFFKRPIHAKYLKILPVKWHKNIAMRLDIMGCYKPSHFEVENTPLIVIPIPECNICSGVIIGKSKCKCHDDEWWNGENCVNHSECPCFVGLIVYPVGSTFTTENCEECTCRLYGLPHCTPKVCPNCPTGLRKVLTPLCGCTCKPCEENTRLCPTSNICLQESSWCDGIQDCPDDELNCTTTTTKVTSTPTPCLASCPPGYDVIYRNRTAGPTEAEDMVHNSKVKSVKTKKSVKTYRKTKKYRKPEKMTECPPYDCVPVKETSNECPAPECPLDYTIIYKEHNKGLVESCPLYACEPVPEFSSCTVLSKNIQTFDGNQYKYEICDHVLVTHDSGLWNVTMVKNCSYSSGCMTILLINHGDHVLELHSHYPLIKVNSFPYSSDQIELFNSKTADFSINPIGNFIIFTSNVYGFQVIYDMNGNFKIKVPTSTKGHLSGLCGLYNGHPEDDKTRSDGKLSKTTVDFGASWSNPGGKECIETACPIEMQNIALEICLKLKGKPFNLCSEQVNMELCVESTCECLVGKKTLEECKCQQLSNFATECKNTNLFGWRVEHDCPSSCAPNLVHYDCYPYACQPTCSNEECTEPAANCYSGCFCPDGLVKRGDQCIKVAECRDCVCSGMGDSTYLTFDGGLTFNGNCTYIATREKTSATPSFEILISNSLCNGSDFMTCTDKMEIRAAGHSVEIIALPGTFEMVKVLLDGVKEDLKVEKLDASWAKISFNPESSVVEVGLPREHIDVRYFYKRFAFSISLPSHLYSDKVEGLCGSCSQKAVDSEEINDPEAWQTEKGENCLIEPPSACIPTAEHEKFCLFMNNTKIFGQCLAFVDPTPFIDQCLTLMCINGHICNSLEAYGQACRDAGVCVDWRSHDFCPFTCPSDLEYQPCNNGCQKTCENYDEIDFTCTGTPVEGCFCPKGKILIEGTCKAEKYCEYCDEEGHHYEDDLWQVDRCTNCTCRHHIVTCEKTECLASDISCHEDEIIIKEENEFECCPKYKCGCKHRDECTKIEIPQDLSPGMEAVINDTGCCQKLEIVCRKENCPEPKPCKEHYIQRKINTTNCCPDYICEKPDNICFYVFGDTSSENKTRIERGVSAEVVKEVGERWSDGNCKTCICIEKNGFAEAVCTVTECPPLKDHLDFKDYVLEETFHPEKCCPEVIRKSCKHKGLIYGVGDSWVPDENNPCETLKCNNWGGFITKETRLEVCNTDCELGWEYEHSGGSCCGHCVQKGCLINDKLYREGEIWHSEDNCSKSTCLMSHGHFFISTETKTCPPVDDCPREDIYEDGCCLKCRIRTEDKRNCLTQVLPPEETIELIHKWIGRHGKCQNLHPIHNFTRCAGNCDSHTVYNAETLSHDSICKCCKPEEYSTVEIELKCEDGKELKKEIMTPSRCSCTPCGG